MEFLDFPYSSVLKLTLGHMVAVSGTVPLEAGDEDILQLSEVEIQK